MYKGIGAAAENFDIPKSEVNEIVMKAIKGHKTRLCQGNVCCYFCGENFHLAKDCSCYKCGMYGHLAKDCSGTNGDGGVDDDDGSGGLLRRFGCYKCGQVGHKARKCDQVGGNGGDCVCYNCGETGHIAWECS